MPAVPTICAVVPPGVPAPPGPVDRVLVASSAWGSAIREAASDGSWVWALDGTAAPRPGALEALVAAAERLEGVVEPALLTSRVVGASGALSSAHVPLAPQDQTAVALRTAHARVLHVRAVTGGSLLLSSAAAARVPADAPPGRAATMAWTALLLRDAAGFLVPESVADATGASPGAREDARVAAALLLGGALRGRERLRLAADVAERALMRPLARAGRRARRGPR